MTLKDNDGQPRAQFPAALISNYGKTADQLIGICRGILIDGHVNDAEAEGLRRFVTTVCEKNNQFPFGQLKARLDKIWADDVITDEERVELRGIMMDFAGLTDESVTKEAETTRIIPFDSDRNILFSGKNFVVTGRFGYGTRSKVETEIEQRGGLCAANVSQKTNYLVVGHFASRDWIYTNWGQKIERAVEIRQELGLLRILSEADWVKSLA